MKLIKSIGLGITIFMILNLVITIFSYFNIFNDNIIHILKIISFIITMIFSGFVLGYKYKKYGLLNGLKQGFIYIFISLFFILILPNLDFSIKILIYYMFILLLCIIGSIVGVNIKKTISK